MLMPDRAHLMHYPRNVAEMYRAGFLNRHRPPSPATEEAPLDFSRKPFDKKPPSPKPPSPPPAQKSPSAFYPRELAAYFQHPATLLNGALQVDVKSPNPSTSPQITTSNLSPKIPHGLYRQPQQSPKMSQTLYRQPQHSPKMSQNPYQPLSPNMYRQHQQSPKMASSQFPKMEAIPETSTDKKLKPVRPFKAFSNELLLNTMMPYGPMDENEMFYAYANLLAPRYTKPENTNTPSRPTPPSFPQDPQLSPVHQGDSSSSDGGRHQPPDTSSNQSRRRGRSLPEELKDEAYWERRRKNNEAAKRSRDTRRQKEDLIAMRAKSLYEECSRYKVLIVAYQERTNVSEARVLALTEELQKLNLKITVLEDELTMWRKHGTMERPSSGL